MTDSNESREDEYEAAADPVIEELYRRKNFDHWWDNIDSDIRPESRSHSRRRSRMPSNDETSNRSQEELNAYRERQREIATSRRYDDRLVRNVTKIEDRSDLEGFIEKLEEYAEDDSEDREFPYWLKGVITVHETEDDDVNPE